MDSGPVQDQVSTWKGDKVEWHIVGLLYGDYLDSFFKSIFSVEKCN